MMRGRPGMEYNAGMESGMEAKIAKYHVLLWPLLAFGSILALVLNLAAMQGKSLVASARMAAQRELLFAQARGTQFPENPRILGLGAFNSDGQLLFRSGITPSVLEPGGKPEPVALDWDRRSVRVVERFDPAGPAGGGIPLAPNPPELAALFIELHSPELFSDLSRLLTFSILAVALLLLAFVGAEAISYRSIRTRDRLAAAEELARLGSAARILGHEIRNPLAAIRLRLEFLKRKSPPDQDGDLEEALGEIGRLAALAERIGDFTRDPRGELSPVQPAAFCEGIASRLGVRVDASAVSPETGIYANGPRLTTAFTNLLRNALESGSAVEDIVIQIAETDQQVAIRILDRGTGLPPGFSTRRFEPFQTTKASGMGIGLTIARRFIGAAGGQVSLVPREGGGAIASILMKRAKL